MSLKIDPSIPKPVADVIRDGYQKINALWPISHSVSFVANKGKTRNGYCKKLSNTSYKIAINEEIVQPKDILNVVVHELIHSYPDVFPQGHKGEWVKRAAIVNQTYGLHVQRTNSYERSKTYSKRETKYHIWCTQCHHEWSYSRAPKWINYVEKAKCPYCHTYTIQVGKVLKTL